MTTEDLKDSDNSGASGAQNVKPGSAPSGGKAAAKSPDKSGKVTATSNTPTDPLSSLDATPVVRKRGRKSKLDQHHEQQELEKLEAEKAAIDRDVMIKALTQEIRGVEQGALVLASMRLRKIHPGATLHINGKDLDPGTYAREQMALSDAEVLAIAEPLADMGLPRLPPWVILALVSAMIVAPRVETYKEIEGALRVSLKAQEPTG